MTDNIATDNILSIHMTSFFKYCIFKVKDPKYLVNQ